METAYYECKAEVCGFMVAVADDGTATLSLCEKGSTVTLDLAPFGTIWLEGQRARLRDLLTWLGEQVHGRRPIACLVRRRSGQRDCDQFTFGGSSISGEKKQ